MALLLLVIFLLFVILLERKTKEWICSPIVLLCFPTSLLIVLYLLLRPYTLFIPFSENAILITLLGFCCFWVGSISYRLAKKIISCNYPNIKPNHHSRFDYSFIKYIIAISLICIMGMLLDLKSILGQRSLMMLEDQEFANNGLSAHMGNYISITIIFLFGCIFIKEWKIKKIFTISILSICLLLKFLTAVKGYLLLPIIGGLIFIALYGKIKITVKSVALISLCSFILFVSMGVFFNISTDDQAVSSELLFNFFSFYLFSGLTGLSGNLNILNLQFGEHPNWIVRFFENFYEKFFTNGQLTLEGGAEWVRVTEYGAYMQHDSNVATLIGEIYINCGYIIGSMVLFIVGWYASYLFHKAKNNYIFGLVYSYVGACLFFNFFSTYIIQPGFYESQAFCFLVLIFTKTSHKFQWLNQIETLFQKIYKIQ